MSAAIWDTVVSYMVEPMPATGINALDILGRLLCALLAGFVVGLERELSRHPAGLRTNMLVCLGACIVMVTAESICNRYFGISTPDPARLGAQVISGVGFLGAGTIIHKGVSVQGLTTAASLWTVACLGLSAGNGDYFVVIVCAVLVSFILSGVERISVRMFRQRDILVDMTFHTIQLSSAMNHINDLASKNDFSVMRVHFCEEDERIMVDVRAKFVGKNAKHNMNNTMNALFLDSSVKKMDFSEISEH